MRIAPWLVVSLASMCAWSASSYAEPPRGIEVGDLDKKVDPCNDFFEFSNGAWRAANPIPNDMPRWSRRWKSGEDTKIQLRAILDEAAAKTDWAKGSVEQLIGDFYSACMDEARANELGVTPLKPLFAEIDAVKDAAGVQRIIRELADIGVGAPFGVGTSPDNHDPTQVVAVVAASGLSLPDRDYYLKPDARFKESRDKYRAHIVKMFQLAGWAAPAATKAAETVFKIETSLAQHSVDNVALRDPKVTDHKMSFAALEKLAPRVEWAAFFDGAHMPKIDLNVTEPKFLEEVNRQLAATPIESWKVYLDWQLLNAAASALSNPLIEEDFAFNGQILRGAKELKPRWKRCAEATDQQLGEALGKKYVEKYFPPEAKARMQEMVKNLLAAMKVTIEGTDWMTPTTKKRALEKLATFNPKIGYPDKWKDYSSIAISRASYWDDLTHTQKWNVADGRSQVGKPVDRGRWGLSPPTSDAYYNPLQNEIVFPAGILQPPAFNINATDAVNYGAIGVVIGHEVSHGFDDEGAQYDAQGRLDNWWTPEDLKHFQERGQCVVNQFDHYFIEPGIHHTGKLVLGESIGDLAGAKIAYRAYHLAHDGKIPEATIDGYTPDQQFFIAWGQFRGDAVRPEMQRFMVQSDPHPVAKFRVIGPVSNLEVFAKIFHCKADAPMVRPPKDRCEVW